MKKFISLLMALVLVFALVACSSNENADDKTNGTQGLEGPITVVSREDGSGTRGAFVEIVGVEDENGNDMTTQTAFIQDGTGKVIETVAGDETSIGYISLGSLDGSDVKAVSVDGTKVSADTVLSGDYSIQRPLNIAYKAGSLSPLAQDFVDFIMSQEGQKIAVDEGFIQVDPNAKAYEAKDGLSGEINVSGSTSVAPLVEVAAEEYEKLHDGVKVVVNATGSSAGIKDATDGVVDFGMASRELKEDELKNVEALAIAKDGIAVVVSKENPIEDISLENIRKIFLGEITDWSEVK